MVEVPSLLMALNNNKRALLMNRFFHCTDMDTGSTKQMEDICRQESPSSKTKLLQPYGGMCQLSPILLISFQEELILEHFQDLHYGGRDHNGFHRSHPAGLQQRSMPPQKTLKSGRHMLRCYNLQRTSQKDSPS